MPNDYFDCDYDMLNINEITLRKTTAARYGIVNISVANLRSHPIFQSELVNQLVLGSIVPVLEQQNSFYYIKNWDGYKGWLSERSLHIVTRAEAESWHSNASLSFMDNHGWIKESPAQDAEVVSDVVAGSLLRQIEAQANQTLVGLPDGRSGYVMSAALRPAWNGTPSDLNPENPEALVRTARGFLGIPYLWGGTSAKAFDCSGFIQTIFRFHDIALPRDAREIINIGETIAESDLRIGDLLFFGKTFARITHIALYIGDGLFVHADGQVRIESMEPSHPRYNEFRHRSLLKATRVLG